MQMNIHVDMHILYVLHNLLHVSVFFTGLSTAALSCPQALYNCMLIFFSGDVQMQEGKHTLLMLVWWFI
jgi:SNF family Na+-dependent transporter